MDTPPTASAPAAVAQPVAVVEELPEVAPLIDDVPAPVVAETTTVDDPNRPARRKKK